MEAKQRIFREISKGDRVAMFFEQLESLFPAKSFREALMQMHMVMASVNGYVEQLAEGTKYQPMVVPSDQQWVSMFDDNICAANTHGEVIFISHDGAISIYKVISRKLFPVLNHLCYQDEKALFSKKSYNNKTIWD